MRRAKSSSKVRGSHNPRLWFSLSIVQLLVLLIDFALYPKFFKSRQRLPGIDANILINKPFVHLGTIDTVDFNVSLESLNESDSLGYFLESHKSRFVTSVFIDLSLPEPERIFEGELLTAVRDRLRSASLVADQRLEEFI